MVMEQGISFLVLVAAAVALTAILRMRPRKHQVIEDDMPSDPGSSSPPTVNDLGSLSNSVRKEAGSVVDCVLTGTILIVVGFYFLLNPSIGDTTKELGMNVANLQLLDIGETCTIAGAIFLAVGIRPRRL